jgi:glucokinase
MALLVGDIGATKALLAWAETDGTTVSLARPRRFATADFPSLDSMLATFCAGTPSLPAAACLGVPGPVAGGACRTTNLPWLLEEVTLAAACGLERVLLVNDFEATARGVLATPPRHLHLLHGPAVRTDQVLAVLGPGSGLGEAVVVPHREGHLVLPSEGGHADFAPRGELQRALAATLAGAEEHVALEHVLSGPGLVRIYEFLVRTGRPAAAAVERAAPARKPAAITRLASSGHRTCQEVVELFVRVLGAEAGNLALRCLARGGVVVAGGIAPRILPKLADGAFVTAFLAKGSMRGLLEEVPLAVCTDPATPLRGAALLGHERLQEDRFQYPGGQDNP